MLIDFDQGPAGRPVRFEHPVSILVAHSPGDVEEAFRGLDTAVREGFWVAGYASYELGYLLEPRLTPLLPRLRQLPLLHFGVFTGPTSVPTRRGAGTLASFERAWTFARYQAAFDRVMEYIRAGDIYQANLTMPLHGRWSGQPDAIYDALVRKQPVGYGALVQTAHAALLSRSPELFFALDGRGSIETRPMKGTAPRHADPAHDADIRAALLEDPKTRAENLMIVDLLRNDLGRIAEIGSVAVPELFQLETYATVHQMTSRVIGRLLPGIGLAGIFAALFPCGSVTGAPKIRAMEIIRELEPWPRGAYCGAIGWAAPDGRAQFSVAIRTVTLFPEGRSVLNVGGGIVADSTADMEYEEALWKARFATWLHPS